MLRLIFITLLNYLIVSECRDIKRANLLENDAKSNELIGDVTNTDEKKLVCYWANWSVNRTGIGKFAIDDIDPFLCTHLIYAFASLDHENGLKPSHKEQDIIQGGYANFTNFKTINPNLKTMVTVGGWNAISNKFSELVSEQKRRLAFVQNVIKFLRQNNFDGLDVDWQYREKRTQADKENYPLMLQELREEFDKESIRSKKPRLLLTMTVPVMVEKINNGYDLPNLAKYLDFMNVLNYDYHSSFEPVANHHSPLYYMQNDSEYQYDPRLNVDFTIKYCLQKGVDPKKLILGIPTYGRSFTLLNSDNTNIGSPAKGPGVEGEATGEEGFLAYYEICTNVKNRGWSVVNNKKGIMGPLAHHGNQWIAYDDVESVQMKAKYANEKGLGGVMFWSLDMDDFKGICDGQRFPLIEGAKETLSGSSNGPIQTFKNFVTRLKRMARRYVLSANVEASQPRRSRSPAPQVRPSAVSNNKRETESQAKKVVCYVTNASSLRNGIGRFLPSDINPFSCTHLIYAYATINNENGLSPSEKHRDIEQGGYSKFNALKVTNKDLKTMLSIGGWSEQSQKFSSIIADKSRRSAFAQNVVRYLRLHNFDGLDVDWRVREKRTTADRENYPLLLKELREEFDKDTVRTKRSNLLLSITVPVIQEKINEGYDIANLNKYVDFMNLLAFDYHSSFEPYSNHHSPLYYQQLPTDYQYDPDLCVDFSVRLVLERGADVKKVVVGIPLYGRSYSLTNPNNVNLGSPAEGPGEAGETIGEKGYLPYSEICTNIQSEGWKIVNFKKAAMGPHAVRGNQWIGYDDLDSVRLKARYVNGKGLGGIMYWSMEMDDFRGSCHGRPFPLIEAGKETLQTYRGNAPPSATPLSVETDDIKPIENADPEPDNREENNFLFQLQPSTKPPKTQRGTKNPAESIPTQTENFLIALQLDKDAEQHDSNSTRPHLIGKIFFLSPVNIAVNLYRQ